MKLRLILGDQLNIQHSWYSTVDQETLYVLYELKQETNYVVHHIQKVVAFFSSMRSFADSLKSIGHEVIYFDIASESANNSLSDNIKKLVVEKQITKFEYQLPDEYRLDKQLINLCEELNISTERFDSEHFLTKREDLKSFFEGKKQLIMEFFYRDMRKKYDILMDQGQPLGGQWNFDKNNRKKWKGTPTIPAPFKTAVKSQNEIISAIQKAGIKTFGNYDEKDYLFPSNRDEALVQLEYFCKHLLVHFGDYQDAMHNEQRNLFHSRISFALNVKILNPKEVIDSVISHYHKNSDVIALSQVEGFVRQILGWREYMRGIYWREMPDYKSKNQLDNYNKLPDFYWTGATKMNCLQKSITDSLDTAYAHHIQRLMITGNFALLIQCHPDEVDAWYLGVYADAVEWVQLPNTRGMSQWADGGIVATKPYVSSGSYIHKMSNYCETCIYDRTKRIGEDACPFNSLYWNFLDDKKTHFSKNNRMAMMLRLLDKIPALEKQEIKERALSIIENPDDY
ncbi:MAG: cryptochrome/photolyase family protein [Flavobacteriales bacterium MED-G15]|nr:MAG: cryptochrome/photolyase family protein [Flavobacteriales bacterium MED-G15]